MPIKTIGLLTSGGDGSGMNAAIRSVARYALSCELVVKGVMRGYQGLVDNEVIDLNHRYVSNIINKGGTILKTARCAELLGEEGQRQAIETIKRHNIDGLIVIGGNGSYRGAKMLWEKWQVPCVGVPGTIDNDINGTDATIGADTAVNTALSAIDKIRDTCTSMERIFVIEVMGRDSGFIALQVALGGGAEEALVPERGFDLGEIAHKIVEGNLRGKVSWIVIVAEGAGSAADIAAQITRLTSLETRVVVLGHIQRGGIPTAQDRILATRLGAAAVDALREGEYGCAVGMVNDAISVIPFAEAIKKKQLGTDGFYRLINILT